MRTKVAMQTVRWSMVSLPAWMAILGLTCVMPRAAQAENDIPREKFFAPAESAGRDLSADEIYPRGRQFPISLYSVGGVTRASEGWPPLPEEEKQRWMSRVADDGFTMFGPQYELSKRVLQDAGAHGVKAIYSISGRGLIKRSERRKGYREMAAPEVVRKGIEKQVRAVMDDPNLAWWYLKPEELRYWRSDEIKYLEIAAETIRQTDPQKRPVWMYDPGHRNADSLAKTVKHLDICGKGMYTPTTAGNVSHACGCAGQSSRN